MTFPLVGVDIDNVVAKAYPVLCELIDEYTRGRVHLEPAQLIDFDYCNCPAANGERLRPEEWQAVLARFHQRENLLRLEPVDGMARALRTLQAHCKIVLLTCRPKGTESPTREWLYAHHVDCNDVRFVDFRAKHRAVPGLRVAIDDDYEQALSYAQSAIPCLLPEYPWNSSRPSVPNVIPVQCWQDALPLFRTLWDRP